MQLFTDLSDRASEQISGGNGNSANAGFGVETAPGAPDEFKRPTPPGLGGVEPPSYTTAGLGKGTAAARKA